MQNMESGRSESLTPDALVLSRAVARFVAENRYPPAERKLAKERTEIVKNCKEWVLSHTAGPMYWLRHWTATENYHWKEQGLPPVAPFPYKPYRDRSIDLAKLPFPHAFTEQDPPDYLDIVMGFFLFSKDLSANNEVWIPKTREMMTSWLAVGFITWFCQFYETTGWIAQSEKDDKAQGLVKYANILYLQQPDWLRVRYPLKRGETGSAHRIDWANGSWFKGVPQGERQLASDHPHGYFNDETAHQAGVEDTISIAKPAVRQIICVSSVAPGFFWNQVSEAA